MEVEQLHIWNVEGLQQIAQHAHQHIPPVLSVNKQQSTVQVHYKYS